ncbi:MAG: hypothetical protein IAF94_09590 [Pirellulaceae bacterium]|nr:hypothetical protein [Pirellulaceae bacterium]
MPLPTLIADLRHQMAKLEGSRQAEGEEPLSTGCKEFDRLLPRGGLLRGTVVEWLADQPGSGAGMLALLCARQACRAGRALVVMDRQRSFYPPAAAWGYDLTQMLVIRSASEEDELWALDQALRCRGVGAVYAPLAKLGVHDFRRLQLAAECGGTLGLFLRPATVRGDPSWADLQLAVRPRASPSGRKLCVEIVRCRGGTAGRSIELEITGTGMVQKASMSHDLNHQTHPLSATAELARAKIADCRLRIAE